MANPPHNEYSIIPFPGLVGGAYFRYIPDPQGLDRVGYAAVIDASSVQLDVPDTEMVVMEDVSGTSRTVFYRRFTFDETGAIISQSDFDQTGAAYTVTGVAAPFGTTGATFAGSTDIAFTDAAVLALAPPAGVTVALIHVWGGAVVWTATGSAPNEGASSGIRNNDGDTIKLESTSEVVGFRFIGLTGESGSLHVEYFS